MHVYAEVLSQMSLHERAPDFRYGWQRGVEKW